MAILDTVTNLLTKVSAALSGPVIPAVIEIAKEVIDLADEVKTTVNQTDADALQILRDELEAKVLAHADSTEKALRGEG